MSDTVKQFLGRLSAEHKLQAELSASSSETAYKSARVDRHNEGFQPSHRSGDAAIYESWDLMTRRIRDMARNDPFVKRAGNAVATLVVGGGIQSFAEAIDLEALMKPTPSLDDLMAREPFNIESDHHFELWAETGADVHGEKSWAEIQRLAMREMVNTGNGMLIRCQKKRPNQTVLLCWDFVEWEQLDRAKDRPAGERHNKIVNGIEYDSAGRNVGYWIFDAHPFEWIPGSAFASESRFIPAARVTHLFLPDRPSARSGASWLNALMQPARDLDHYLGNELTSAALGALLVAAVKRKDPGKRASLGLGSRDAKQDDTLRWGKGIVADVFTDEQVEVLQSKRPPGSAVPWLDLILHQLAASCDVSYYRLTGNYSKTSYSSTRAAQLDDEIFNHPLQMFFARKIVRPTRVAHDRQMAAMGAFRSVSANEYFRDEADYSLFYLIGSGRPLLDPDKEIKGAAGLLRMRLSTLKEQCGKRGLNWRSVLRQAAIEQEFARRLGLTLDFTDQQGGQPEAPDPEQVEEERQAETVDDNADDHALPLLSSLENRFNGHALTN